VKVGDELRQCLEKAHLKLDSVVSDLLGVSVRVAIRAVKLRAALDGRLNERYRFPMRPHWDLLETLEKRVEKLEREIGQRVIPFEWAVRLPMTAPGIRKIAAPDELGGRMPGQ
jgi:transposase